ncbi:MAG: BspA family leucine-rich repeat surface protein [Firmicutes bacterium]|nr:BspA family leucine-rich repeat surface protein [Bacillota bacterium]
MILVDNKGVCQMNNRKGFTLIELLAVIVILGLLMAIAIPSVTKYITESRKKTVVSTIGNYMTAMVNEVNDLTYTFTEANTIYAVPIECIALERGGTNPFGEWHQASNAYWAYVLVQYDDETSSYIYGYTFKDSAGYGLYPTSQAKLNEQGKQIQTNLDIKRPRNGSIENVTSKSNWNGFIVDDDTQLKVLKATTEGNVGDGEKTCTLLQKANNYEQVQQEVKDMTLVKYAENTYFWEYREQIKNITFEDTINIPDNVYKSWDVSETGNGKVMAYIVENSGDSSFYNLYIQGDGEIYANRDSSYLFSDFKNVDNINNINLLNTCKTTNMYKMFYKTGYSSTVFTLDLGNNFDTSNVKTMAHMFRYAGYSNTRFTLDLGDNFDTSKVNNMGHLFYGIGYSSTVFTLDLGDKFDTSNVTDMTSMFRFVGYSNPSFLLELGSRFDTSKVNNMTNMFCYAGYSSTIFTLNLGDKFDTSNVTDMSSMFDQTGFSSTKFTLDLGNKFDTSNVIDMSRMFYVVGYRSSLFKLDCSSWNVDKVTSYSSFNAGSESKVTPPKWVN